MSIISQTCIFDYIEVENLGDLERLKLFFDNIEDNELCEKLEKERKNGRNDYPIRVMLNLLYAMKIFGHRSVESFRRELSRNSQLRVACGLSEGKYKYWNDRKHLVPPARVFTGIIKKLSEEENKIELRKINEKLVEFMYENLENFGEDVAIDGKYLDTYGNQYRKNKCNDLRGEHDATASCKTYINEDGSKKNEWHYGFRAHIFCDSNYGLPIKYKVTPANNSEQKELDNMLEEMEKNERKKLDKMKNLMADAGYDNGERNKLLKQKYDINAIVDIRYMWSKDEEYREIEDKMIAYNQKGEVYYITENNEHEKMQYLGYDKKNESLRYTRYSTGNNVYRIPLDTDRRIFTPVARDSAKFKKLYKKRTEVERLNGRIDRDYMFNDHFIRGLDKMDTMLTLSFIVMLTLAKGRIKENKTKILGLVG